MKIEVSNGEIMDKLSILEIKLQKIRDDEKLINVRNEFLSLKKPASKIIDLSDESYKALVEVNSKLWDIEDLCREYERKKDFGEDFIQTVRRVYVLNDERARIKKEINIKTGSDLIEEKSYKDY